MYNCGLRYFFRLLPNRSLNMLVVCVASPFISLDMFEKKSLVAPDPIDVTDAFLISELVETGLVGSFMGSLTSSSKLDCSWLKEEDSPNNPTCKKWKINKMWLV